MRQETVTYDLYSLDELSESAQEKAHHDYLCNGFEYAWLDESIESVKAFLDIFGATLENYELSTYREGCWLKSDISQDLIRDRKLKDIPLIDANLTGYCLDYSLLKAFHDYAKSKGDILGAIRHALDVAASDIQKDMEYQESFEAFKEMSECNNWEYLKSGKQYW